DRQKGEDRYLSHSTAGVFPGKTTDHPGWGRLAARPHHDPLRRWHGRRQSAPSFRSALPDGGWSMREVQDRPEPGLQAGHTDVEPAAQHSARRWLQTRKDRRQYRALVVELTRIFAPATEV